MLQGNAQILNLPIHGFLFFFSTKHYSFQPFNTEGANGNPQKQKIFPLQGPPVLMILQYFPKSARFIFFKLCFKSIQKLQPVGVQMHALRFRSWPQASKYQQNQKNWVHTFIAFISFG